MAEELREYGITAVSLYPGLVRTESVMNAAALAQEYGFTDFDGKQPLPLTINDV